MVSIIVNIFIELYYLVMKWFYTILLIIIGINLYSHPHMQILNRSTFDFKDEKISGVWLEWEFDAYFSADIIMSYDLNEDGVFSESEKEDIYNNAFISLKDFNFFTYLRVGGNRTSPKEVENFSAYIDDKENLFYRFYVDLSFLEEREFYLSVYDFSYFCACFYQEESPVNFINNGNLDPEFKIKKNEEYPVYFDPYAGPDDTTVYTEWKKGLNEVVIKEIYVKY